MPHSPCGLSSAVLLTVTGTNIHLPTFTLQTKVFPAPSHPEIRQTVEPSCYHLLSWMALRSRAAMLLQHHRRTHYKLLAKLSYARTLEL